MFGKLALPLFIAASVAARPASMRRDTTIPPLSQWQSSGLESYWTFKVRYTSLGCAEQQGSDYYNECCYPLAANTTASSDCTPTSLVCAGVNPYDPSASLTTTTSSSVAAPTPAPTDDTADQTTSEDDYDESNLPICEDPNDDGYYSDDDESESSSYNDQAYTPPANDQSTPTSSADDSQSTPDNSGSDNQSNNNQGSTDNSNTNTGNTNTGSSEIGNAFATFYYQNGNAGACGNYHSDYDLIGAIDQAWYGDLGQQSQYCGRSVTITNTNNGKQVTITVADVCPTCDTDNSFDLSVGAFNAIADPSEGEVAITWHFN